VCKRVWSLIGQQTVRRLPTSLIGREALIGGFRGLSNRRLDLSALRPRKTWHGGTPRIFVNFRVLGKAGTHSRTYTVSTGLPLNCDIPSFCMIRHRTKKLTRAAPRSSTHADVREHGARLKRIPYINTKQYGFSAAACDGASPADGARQPRTSHHCQQLRLVARVFVRNTDVVSVILLIEGTQFGYLADFGPFSKCEVNTKIRAECGSHGTRDGHASTSPGGGAAGVLLRTMCR